MSVAEIIEQIKALPPEEFRKVSEFVFKHIDAPRDLLGESSRNGVIRYATDDQAREAGDRVIEKHAELFKKLAE
jgi:hypothetical protein